MNTFTSFFMNMPLIPLQQFAMGIIPLCSEQFRRTFNTTRIPLKEQGVDANDNVF